MLLAGAAAADEAGALENPDGLREPPRVPIRAALHRNARAAHALRRRRAARRRAGADAPRRAVVVVPLPEDGPDRRRRRSAGDRTGSDRLRAQRQASEPGRTLV